MTGTVQTHSSKCDLNTNSCKAAVPCGLYCLLQLQQQSNDTITTDSRHISFVVSNLVSSYYLRKRPNQYFQSMPLYSNPDIDLSDGGGSSIMFNRVIPKPLELAFKKSLIVFHVLFCSTVNKSECDPWLTIYLDRTMLEHVCASNH